MPRVFRLFSMLALGLSLLLGMSILLPATSVTHAQVSGADPLTLSVSPQYPTPYSTVTITPSSDVFDIAGASVSVLVNGASFYKGTGGAPINVPMGGPGSISKIAVTVTSADGQTATEKVTLRPADVALVVEPISTTHPFYAGEGLVPSEGRVRLVAIPDLRTSSGVRLDPSKLVYTWSLGDQVLDSSSGVGQSVLDATAPQRYRDAAVSLTVSSQDGALTAKAQTTISPVDPLVRIYEDDPLLGPLFDTAISSSFAMTDAEDSFMGIPYYFTNTPTLSWTVNGSVSGSDPDITVRSTGSGSGNAAVGFSANDTNSGQTANSTVSVAFGQKNSIGLFGL